jgi:predicted DNA binding CopG/RHH family protein
MANKKNKQPNKEVYLDQEEKELIKSMERGEWRPLPEKEKKEVVEGLSTAAKNSLAKNKTVSLRLSERDLRKLKERAAEEGIPYQTLVSSLIHKYVKE